MDLNFKMNEQIHVHQSNSMTFDETLLLKWHNRLGRMPFKTIKHMARSGLLDKRLANVKKHHFAQVVSVENKAENDIAKIIQSS